MTIAISTQHLLYPIADALGMDMEVKNGTLYGKMEIDFDVIDDYRLTSIVKVVDSVIDVHCGTAGVIFHVSGCLYLAVISDHRVQKLTVFVVDGTKAGFKFKENGRLGTLDALTGAWSRKKFYSRIAPGVRATFERSWHSAKFGAPISEGPEEAMAYLAKREEGKSPSQTAEELNKEFADKRKLALLKRPV